MPPPPVPFWAFREGRRRHAEMARRWRAYWQEHANELNRLLARHFAIPGNQQGIAYRRFRRVVDQYEAYGRLSVHAFYSWLFDIFEYLMGLRERLPQVVYLTGFGTGYDSPP